MSLEKFKQTLKACADIVKQLTSELDAESAAVGTSEQSEEGESLLLPLIQGILQNPKYRNLSARQLLSLNLSKTIAQQSGLLPPSSSLRMNSEHNELNANNRLGNDYLPIEDSGTESGEDLRLLAAGLQSNLATMEVGEEAKEVHESPLGKVKGDALGAGLLMEVTTALARLQNSLNQGEIDLDESKKTALLSLVNRLQRGLISPEKIVENADTDSAVSVNGPSPSENLPEHQAERRGSGGGVNRFAKRRNRNNRHTVGVTREELADARRIIEELELIGLQNSNPNLNKPKITATVVNSKPGVYNAILTRQFSEPITLLRPSQFVPKDTIKQIELNKPKYKVLLKQSISLDQPVSILKMPIKQEVIQCAEVVSAPFRKLSLQRNPSGSNKFVVNNNHKADDDDDDDAPTDESSSSDDEDEMVNTKYFSNTAAAKFKAKENYLRNQQDSERMASCYSSGDETSTPGPRQPKYTSKKMKMKRANTVDLPKSFSFVNTFDVDCSDSETSKNTYQNRSALNAGLRTTITGGSDANKLPPQFTPKTENDKKFLAFISKQNTGITPTYVNPGGDRNKTHNWTNKFGNLKNRFENDEPQMAKLPPKAVTNAAANFWKSIEKDKPSAKVSPMPPVQIAAPMIKNLPIVSEKFPWKNPASDKIIKAEEPIVVKKKPMMDKFIPKEQPATEVHRVIPSPNKLPVLKPSNVNNFSHAPMSAFKPPISRKLSNSFKPIALTDEVVPRKPLPQVSNGMVKQMAESGYSVNDPIPQPRKVSSSPTRSIADSSFVKVAKPLEKAELAQPVPWAGKPKSERVLNLAASKFENVPTVHLASHLSSTPTEPIVKYRNNPLYNGTFEKRSSLPPNASYASFDPATFNLNGNAPSKVSGSIPSKAKEPTFVTTDYTPPTLISTYAPTVLSSFAPAEVKTARPTYDRQDSLTNPAQEPLVLTCNRTVFSPRDKPKILELYDIPTPNSSQISNDTSMASICDDLDHELQVIGDGVECKAAVSRVMKAPVAQTAVTQSSELTSLNDQSKENSMMKSLHDSLKKLAQKSPTPEKRTIDVKRLSQDSSNSSIDLKLSPVKMQPLSESRLSKDSSGSSIDFKPPFKIPVPAVPETAYSITYASPPKIQIKSPSIGPTPHVLYNNVAPQNYSLNKSRSTHTLVIPKPTDPAIPPQGMYGASPALVGAKQKTVQSYFGPQRAESLSIKPKAPLTSHVRPVTFSSPSQPSAIARKISMYTKPVSKVVHQQPALHSLSRSRTMPSLANVELLDESNIDDAFEELLSSTNL